jgi:hypothetical protein
MSFQNNFLDLRSHGNPSFQSNDKGSDPDQITSIQMEKSSKTKLKQVLAVDSQAHNVIEYLKQFPKT